MKVRIFSLAQLALEEDVHFRSLNNLVHRMKKGEKAYEWRGYTFVYAGKQYLAYKPVEGVELDFCVGNEKAPAEAGALQAEGGI